MPDFRVVMTGTTLETWLDPGTEDLPSRINPVAQRPLKFRRALTADQVELRAVVNGVTAPLDAALGGRTFYGWISEYPLIGERPNLTSPAGQSSVLRFTPNGPGHYTVMMRRKGGGGIILHIDAIDFEGG